MARIGLQWDLKKRFLEAGGWHLGGYLDATLGAWHERSAAGENNNLGDIGITPMARYQKSDLSRVSPYVEIGVGGHLLSSRQITTTKRFGGSFQFSPTGGAGIRFGKNGIYDIAYRYQHISDAGIEPPNPGINFHQIRFAIHFN